MDGAINQSVYVLGKDAALTTSECARVSIYSSRLSTYTLVDEMKVSEPKGRTRNTRRRGKGKGKNALNRLRVALALAGKCQDFPSGQLCCAALPSHNFTSLIHILHLSPLISGFTACSARPSASASVLCHPTSLHFCTSSRPSERLNTLPDFTPCHRSAAFQRSAWCVVQGPGSLDQDILQGV